jgi:hypothetical protein
VTDGADAAGATRNAATAAQRHAGNPADDGRARKKRPIYDK